MPEDVRANSKEGFLILALAAAAAALIGVPLAQMALGWVGIKVS